LIHVADEDGFEIELDTNGTFYIAGKELTHCQLGQRFTLLVKPIVEASPNSPRTAPLVTSRIYPGLELEQHDQPRITGEISFHRSSSMIKSAMYSFGRAPPPPLTCIVEPLPGN
jgi:hypothetical protein